MNNQRTASYTVLRKDVIGLISSRPINVLDVGCSNGIVLEYIRSELGADFTVGLELDENFSRAAAKRVDQLFAVDLDRLDFGLFNGIKFDLIILADVLEHTKNPVRLLTEVLKAADDDAEIIISLPNVQHWTAIKNLLIGVWPQRDRGLFDKTHLHFFTLRSIRELATDSGLVIEDIVCNLRIVDKPDARINRLSSFFCFWPLKPYFVYQYVVRLKLR